ncbi:hypothetical protein CIHG_01972 [Coccidioides immitis H538.4]|uniref:Uncharacterized protein n=2 Tax=Coccidioides immitis TaxID=5501 RepID=A0A0J8RHW0_COCIT|nr:hypothetical protein CIRG_06297 [Coccidioides immitis RMSCC 2394]KMU84186.1 hypothetical protein CIHG_01972 [Coccidioides immitis H538.4]
MATPGPVTSDRQFILLAWAWILLHFLKHKRRQAQIYVPDNASLTIPDLDQEKKERLRKPTKRISRKTLLRSQHSAALLKFLTLLEPSRKRRLKSIFSTDIRAELVDLVVIT